MPDIDGVWKCQQCGEVHGDIGDPRWRWTGERWQHHHDYPVGHVDSDYLGESNVNL